MPLLLNWGAVEMRTHPHLTSSISVQKWRKGNNHRNTCHVSPPSRPPHLWRKRKQSQISFFLFSTASLPFHFLSFPLALLCYSEIVQHSKAEKESLEKQEMTDGHRVLLVPMHHHLPPKAAYFKRAFLHGIQCNKCGCLFHPAADHIQICLVLVKLPCYVLSNHALELWYISK